MGLLDTYKGSVKPEDFNKKISNAARIPGAYNANTGANASGGVKIPTPPMNEVRKPPSMMSLYPPQTQKPAIPMPMYDPMAAQKAAEARARAEKQAALDKARTDIGQAKTSMQNEFTRSNQILTDNRVLSNLALGRTLNPFSGKTAYDKGLVQREQMLSDEAAKKDYDTRIAGLDKSLVDMESRSAAEIQARADELKRQALNDYISQADLRLRQDQQLYNQFNQDRNFDRVVLESDRTFDRALARDEIGDRRYEDELGYNRARDARKDAEWDAQFARQIARDAISDERYEREFEDNARRFGIETALKQAAQDRQISADAADRALRERSIALQEREQVFREQTAFEKAKEVSKDIDEYDLLTVSNMAKQQGMEVESAKPEEIRSFVAELKSKLGWSYEEAQGVERYLISIGEQTRQTKESERARQAREKAEQQQRVNDAKSQIYGQDATKFPWQR